MRNAPLSAPLTPKKGFSTGGSCHDCKTDEVRCHCPMRRVIKRLCSPNMRSKPVPFSLRLVGQLPRKRSQRRPIKPSRIMAN
jgi:hypothetical protein